MLLTAASEGWLSAVLGGTGVAVLGLLGRILWRARFGKREDELKASESAFKAVQAIDGVVDALREERLENRETIAAQRARIAELEAERRRAWR